MGNYRFENITMPSLRRLKVVLLPTCVVPTTAQDCGMTLVTRQPLVLLAWRTISIFKAYYCSKKQTILHQLL